MQRLRWSPHVTYVVWSACRRNYGPRVRINLWTPLPFWFSLSPVFSFLSTPSLCRSFYRHLRNVFIFRNPLPPLLFFSLRFYVLSPSLCSYKVPLLFLFFCVSFFPLPTRHYFSRFARFFVYSYWFAWPRRAGLGPGVLTPEDTPSVVQL